MRVLIVSRDNNNPPLAIIIHATSVRKLGERKLQGIKNKISIEKEERERNKGKRENDEIYEHELNRLRNLYNKKIARCI